MICNPIQQTNYKQKKVPLAEKLKAIFFLEKLLDLDSNQELTAVVISRQNEFRLCLITE